MKFKFDADLDFQDDAINSVVDLFKGQNVAKSLFSWIHRTSKYEILVEI